MKALWIALGLWGALTTLSVRADAPRVYVAARAVDPALELEARQVAALARFALAESDGFQWQAADARVRGEEAEARAALRQAFAGLRRGRQAYLRFELDVAIKALEQALADWERALLVLDSPEPVAETLMYLGACHVLSGATAEAARVFFQYHVSFADLAPNAGVFNPEIMRQWDLAGHELATEPGGALEVRVSPLSAEVSVDGRARGTGAQVVNGLAPGEHWVRVSVVGGRGVAGKVRVEPGLTARFDAGALEDSAQLLDLFEHANSQDGAQVLAQELGLDALGVLEVRLGATTGELDLSLRGFDGASGRQVAVFAKQVGPEFGERAAGVRSLVAAWLDRVVLDVMPRDHQVAVTPGSPPERPTELQPAWYRRWWVWAVAGGVVAAGAVTTALVLRDSGDEPAPQPSDSGTLVLEF